MINHYEKNYKKSFFNIINKWFKKNYAQEKLNKSARKGKKKVLSYK